MVKPSYDVIWEEKLDISQVSVATLLPEQSGAPSAQPVLCCAAWLATSAKQVGSQSAASVLLASWRSQTLMI